MLYACILLNLFYCIWHHILLRTLNIAENDFTQLFCVSMTMLVSFICSIWVT